MARGALSRDMSRDPARTVFVVAMCLKKNVMIFFSINLVFFRSFVKFRSYGNVTKIFFFFKFYINRVFSKAL